jgi:hypothetical protein
MRLNLQLRFRDGGDQRLIEMVLQRITRRPAASTAPATLASPAPTTPASSTPPAPNEAARAGEV